MMLAVCTKVIEYDFLFKSHHNNRYKYKLNEYIIWCLIIGVMNMHTSQYGYKLCFFCGGVVRGVNREAVRDEKNAIHFITFGIDGENAVIKQPICDGCYEKRVLI